MAELLASTGAIWWDMLFAEALVITIRECGVVMRSVASVCVCVSFLFVL